MNCAKREQLEKVFSELNRQVIDAWEQVRLEGVDGAEYRKKGGRSPIAQPSPFQCAEGLEFSRYGASLSQRQCRAAKLTTTLLISLDVIKLSQKG